MRWIFLLPITKICVLSDTLYTDLNSQPKNEISIHYSIISLTFFPKSICNNANIVLIQFSCPLYILSEYLNITQMIC